ncbi:Uncharacterised protein [Mycobacteroides abscessus subsp. abscessus]|nr:Uncharacterised protein [Mycobacteroides abscessus subsp. abscessus]
MVPFGCHNPAGISAEDGCGGSNQADAWLILVICLTSTGG